MYSSSRANNYFITAMLYFIAGSILLGSILDAAGLVLPIALNIAVSQLVFIFLPVAVFFLLTRQPVRETLMLRPLGWANAGLSVALGLSILPLLSFLNVLSQFFVENYIGDALLETFSMPYWLNLLLIGVLPAVFEELSTRAIIVSNYRSQPLLATCLVSGLFFGILHLNLNQFVYAFVMGALMAFVVAATGSIFSSMLVHFTINGTMVTLQTVLVKVFSFLGDESALAAVEPTREELLASLAASGMMAALFLPLVGLVLYGLVRLNKKMQLLKPGVSTAAFMEVEAPAEEPGPVATPAFWTAIILFTSYVLVFEWLLPKVLA